MIISIISHVDYIYLHTFPLRLIEKINNMTSINEKKYCNTSIKDVMRWGYGFTSVNGVAQYRDTDCKISKVSWFVITIVGTLFTFFSVYGCFRSYFAYNTVTTVGITNEISTNFPSVTICNQNRIHCKHLYNLIRNCTKVNNLNRTRQ